MESEIFRNTFLAEEVIRAYPKLKAAHDELKRKVSSRRDPTEDAALRELPPEEQRQYEAVRRAIGRTGQLDHGAERLMVVRLHYFNDIPLEDVAEKMSLAFAVIERYREDFIRCVEELLNISACEGCIHFRKFTKQLKACFYCFDTGQLRLQGGVRSSGQGPCPYYKREEEPA